MADLLRLGVPSLSIAAVEHDTGLSKDTLRVWERRYGFPMPRRDDIGERAYPLDQVEKLRIVKRLLDAGHRPRRIATLTLDELQHLSEQTVQKPGRTALPVMCASDLAENIALILSHDMRALRARLTRLLARVGVARFVNEVVGPLNTAVGDAWVRGQMEVFEEHLFTETLQTVLRQAIVALPEPPPPGRPRVLLGTFPGEAHGTGLLMAEAVLALDGCQCISLGVQTPLWDIVLAAAALRADIVALSFSGCMNPNQVIEGLSELRGKLPPAVALWVGGSAPVLQRRRVDHVEVFPTFDEVPAQLQRWRSRMMATA